MTVTPGKKILVSLFEEVLWISSGQFAMLGDSRSVCEHNNNLNDNDDNDDDDDDGGGDDGGGDDDDDDDDDDD